MPAASINRAACRVASDSPPSDPRDAIDRMNTPGSRKWSVSRIRSPSSAPFVKGDDGSIESTATFRSRERASFTSVPISVDFPTPGGPVNPTTAARPVFGNTSRTSAQPSGSSFSTSEIARARARFSPANRRSASSAAVLGSGGTGREWYERMCAVNALRVVNAGLRLVLELCMLAAFAYSGAHTGNSTAVNVVLAIASP